MNYMSEVSKMLGVEFGERFKISDKYITLKSEYYLSEDGICIDKENRSCISAGLLHGILCGDYTISRNHCRPKHNESYWYVKKTGEMVRAMWFDNLTDTLLYKLGNCYRTSEEAESNKKKWIAFYESDEVLEV